MSVVKIPMLNAGQVDLLDFSPPLLRLVERPPNPLGRQVLWILLGMLLFLVLWAIFGRLDIVAVTEGKLVPQTYLKIVQPVEAGTVKEILVREGEKVKAGQVLMRMDTLLTDADAKSFSADAWRKRLTLRRIEAELKGVPFTKDASDPPDLANEIESRFVANRSALAAALAEEQARLIKSRQELAAAEQVKQKLEATLPYYKEQDKAYEKLARDGFAGAIMANDKRREKIEKEQELLTQNHLIESARASISQSQKKLAQIDTDYKRQLHSERNEAQAGLEKVEQEIAKQTHRQTQMELKAPQDSIVKDLATHTAGTVVQPGTVLLTLVPENENLRAEVWVSNEDIGFVRSGQPAKLKFSAYQFQKYGMLEGTVSHVSADAADGAASTPPRNMSDTSSQQKSPLLQYKALITLPSMSLAMDGEKFPLSSGMQVNAEIKLGTRTVAEYLLSPVKKAWHEAARER